MFLSFIYSLPCSNADVELVFPQMKHLFSDRRKRMTTESVSVELKIPLTSILSCVEMHKHI